MLYGNINYIYFGDGGAKVNLADEKELIYLQKVIKRAQKNSAEFVTCASNHYSVNNLNMNNCKSF